MANKTHGILRGGVPCQLVEGHPRPNPLGKICSRSISTRKENLNINPAGDIPV